jgi:hypothetical protein
MTDEEMRIAIAEACGWKKPDDPEVMKFKVGWTSAEKWWMCPGGVLRLKHDIPDYLNDLNAMREAESCFVGDASKAMTYAMHLLRTCRLSIASEYDELNVDYCWHACHATARQRAEAFLKTFNLWKD